MLRTTLFFVIALSSAASAQYVARNDFVADNELAGPFSVGYAENDEGGTPLRVIVVTNARQGQARPYCAGTPTTTLQYDQITFPPTCPFDTFIYRVEYAPGQWSNDALVFARVPGVGAVTDCNDNCAEDANEGRGDCNNNNVPDECEVPALDRRGVTVHTGGYCFSNEESRAAISDDGRYVVYGSVDIPETPGCDCGTTVQQIFRYDTRTGEVLTVSLSSGGALADGDCFRPSVNEDGSVIAFESEATNLAADANGTERDVFVWTSAGIELVSVDESGVAPTCGDSRRSSISDNGRYVNFDSTSPLVAALGLDCDPPPGSPYTRQVYQRDRQNGTTRILSAVFDAQDLFLAAGNADSHSAAMNSRGRYTAYVSAATNLAAGAPGGVDHVYVFDRLLHDTLLVSVSDTDAIADAEAVTPSMDASGSLIAYSSTASNLVTATTPAGIDQIYVAEVTGTFGVDADVTTSWVSRNGATPADSPAVLPAISGDGRWVAFETDSTLTPDDIACSFGGTDVFVVDRTDNSAEKISVGPRGAPASGDLPFIDLDGSKVGFVSDEALALRAQGIGKSIFVRDRNASLELDGTGWVRVPDGAELDLDGTGPIGMTIEAWVRLDDVAANHTIASKWNDVGADERSHLVKVLTGGALEWSLSSDGTNASTLTAGTLTAGAWHHVACTYDGVSRRMYVDGVLVGQATFAGPVHAGSADLALGAHLRDAGTTVEGHLRGRIDELRVWRRPISRLEIRWLLNEGIRGDMRGFFPDLVSVWSFEDGGGDAVAENDGTVEGTVALPRGSAIPFLEFDCDADNIPDDVQVLLEPELDLNGNGDIDACETNGPVSFCADGALAFCPCSNPGDVDTGCDNAQGTGGVRATVTVQNTAALTGTLVGTGFPPMATPTAIVIRGNDAEVTPQPFFDGIRCVGLTGFARLAATAAVGGTSTHELGHGAGPGTYHYQIWYRNTPITFCASTAAANTSSGQSITW